MNRTITASNRLGRNPWRGPASIAVGVMMTLSMLPARVWAKHGGFSQMGAARTFKHAPGVYEWNFRARRGPSPFDIIGLHRIALGPHPKAHPQIVMLYLPGTNMNGEVAVDDVRYSLALYLAAHGVDVWTMDYRTHFIPPATPMKDLSELKGWTNALFESDIGAAVDYILSRTHSHAVFLSGFSRGGSFAYLYAARNSGRVRGLIIYDAPLIGMGSGKHRGMRSHRPAAAMPYATDIGGRTLTYEKRQHLLRMVIDNPDGPAPIPAFKTARENLAHVVYASRSFGGKGGLANPQGGFSNVSILARVLIGYDRYWPFVQNAEDPATPAVLKALHQSKIPVLAFSSTNISPRWESAVAKSAHLTGSDDVSVTALKGWGHLDVICGSRSQPEVFAPSLRWLRRRSK